MEQLPRTLAERLGDRLCPAAPVRRIVRDGGRFRIATDGGSIEADRVLLSCPAAVTGELLAELAPGARSPLAAIPTVPIAVVMLSFPSRESFGRAIDGFGFLVPRGERLGILGTLFCHSIFPGQAPSSRLFLRTMLGGAREPAAADLDDAALLARVRAAHRQALGADPEPDGVWIVRWPEGISQYTVGHLDRVAAAEAAAGAAGVELAGSPYRGVSVNDCIKQARAAAARLAGC